MRIKPGRLPKNSASRGRNIKLPDNLHLAMWALKRARDEQEGSEVKLCRLYREAIEQYVNAEPQQELLARSRFSKSLRLALQHTA